MSVHETIQGAKEIAPLSLVVLQPTSFCNIDCAYCYLPDRNRKRDLTIETVRQTVDRLVDYQHFENNLTICWHSGEPLTRGLEFFDLAIREFARLAPYAKVSHSIQTNGTLLDNHWAKWMAANDVHVGLSIDGPQSMHDQNRTFRSGKGSHEKALQAVKLLQKWEISFGAIAVISADALRDPECFHNFFEENGIFSVGLNVPEIEGVNTSSWISEQDSELRFYNFIRSLAKLSHNGEVRYRELDCVLEAAVSSVRRYKSSNSTLGHILNIAWDGSFASFAPELLSMSKLQHDFCMGDVFHTSILDGLSASRSQEIASEVFLGVEACRGTCEYFGICGGGSPSNKLAENGSMVSTETKFCRLTKKVLTRAVLDYFNV